MTDSDNLTTVKRGRGRPPGSTKAKMAEVARTEPSGDPIQQQIDTLFDIFINTKPATPVSLRAGAMWKKIVEERAPSNAFNVVVTIAPHTIPDTSLQEIVIEAHPMFVTQIFEGLQTRFSRHEAPHELRDVLRCAQVQFEEWAKTAYAPPR